MPSEPTCPDLAALGHFLLGKLSADEVDRVEQHLATCPHCAIQMPMLRVEDELVAAMRAGIPAPRYDETLTASVLSYLKQLFCAQTQTLPPANTESVFGANRTHSGPGRMLPEADFLCQPQQPDELGRIGPYRVLERLGAGGMGVVFRAEDPRLQRQVALKVIQPGLADSSEARLRFLHEARAAAAVEHEHIVTVHEVNEDRGVPYLVMPLLRGQALDERLRDGQPLPLPELLRIGRQVADGLAAAHARGLVHRDVKPGNIFLVAGNEAKRDAENPSRTLSPLPSVRILDFGLVQALGGNPVLSHPGAIVGTPAYMAPEQARGEAVDGRADLFSLGCVLYHMATGKSPFSRSDLISTLRSVALDEPPPPRQSNRKLPVDLDRLILRLLAKRPDDRPAAAAVVARSLRAMEKHLEPASLWRRVLAGLAALTLLMAITALGIWLHQRTRETPPPEPGEITFTTEEPALEVVLLHGDAPGIRLDVKRQPKQQLEPGDYVLQLAAPPGKRKLLPERLSVRAGDRQTLALLLVGEVRRYAGHNGGVMGLAVPANNGLVAVSAGGSDRSLVVWDAAAGKVLHTLEGHEGEVLCVATSARGDVAVSGSGGKNDPPDTTARVWDVPHGREIKRFEKHEDFVTAVALTADGKTALSADGGGRAILWETATGRVRAALERHRRRINAAAFSPDGKLALTAGADGQVIVWQADRGTVVKSITIRPTVVNAAAFGPAGKWITLACADGSVGIWDLAAVRPRFWSAHKDGAWCVAVSTDGKCLLSGGADRIMRLWDTTGKELHHFVGHDRSVRGVAFAADNRHAISCALDHTVRLWRLPPREAVGKVAEAVPFTK